MNDRLLNVRIWARATLLVLLAVLIIAFVLLNMNAVIAPKVHLIFTRYDRPALLPVLVVTSAISIVGTLLARSAAKTLRQLRDARVRARTAGLEREIAEMRKAAPPEAEPGTEGSRTRPEDGRTSGAPRPSHGGESSGVERYGS